MTANRCPGVGVEGHEGHHAYCVQCIEECPEPLKASTPEERHTEAYLREHPWIKDVM